MTPLYFNLQDTKTLYKFFTKYLHVLYSQRSKSIIAITHSEYARKFADRIFEMSDGQLKELK